MTTPERRPQRRAPLWIRRMESGQLHGIANHLRALRLSGHDLSERQEYAWDRMIEELELRYRRSPASDRCACSLCRPPDN